MKKHYVFLLFILSLLFVSCEIGLGSAVDTMPPELVISQPAAGSIIRDSFTIGGNWTDDGQIAAVSLILRDTDNDKKFGPYDAQFETLSNGEGTWHYTLEKDLVPDGNYEVNITIKDTQNHKSENQRQITIDNTAPVLVLQRPFSKLGTESKVESYGQIVTLEGQAADDSGVGLIELNVYSDPELQNLVKTLSFPSIPKTISINAAQFVEGQENDYSAMYGSTSRDAGEQIRYCKIIAYDGAVRFPADGSSQSEADLKGNSTTGYYLYDEISGSLLSDYTVNELYLIKNGRYTGEQKNRSAVIETLASKEIPAAVFSLNPRNNPLFSVAGFSELGPDANYASLNMSVSNGDFLTVQVEPGLDGYLLVKDSLKVKVKDAADTIVPSQQIISKDGDKYKIVVYMQKDDGLKTSHQYSLLVEGYDEKGNAVTTAKDLGYGFYFKRSNVFPTLSVTVPEKEDAVSYNADSTEITISGYVNFPSSICEQGDVIIEDETGNYKWNVGTFSTDSNEPWTAKLKLQKDSSDLSYVTQDFNGNQVTYKTLSDNEWKLYVYAECDDGAVAEEKFNSDKVARTFSIDTQKPKAPVLTKVNNDNYNAEKWYTGQNINIEVTTEDIPRTSDGFKSGIAKTEYKINDGSWIQLNTTEGGYINGLDDLENTLYLRTTDSAGNVSDVTEKKILVDCLAPQIKKALIGGTTASDTRWSELIKSNVKSITNDYAKKIKLEVEENNSVSSVEVKVGGSELSGSVAKDNTTGIWIWESSGPASITENANVLIEVKVTDAAGASATANYKVLIDTAGPVITITSPSEDLSGENSLSQHSYVLKASVSDAAGKIATTKYKISSKSLTDANAIIADYNDANSTGWLLSNNEGTVNVPVIIEEGRAVEAGSSEVVNVTNATLKEGKWFLYVYSVDDAGNENAEKRSFWTDVNSPELEVTRAPEEKYNKAAYTISNKIHFAGTASDVNGIAEIEYSKDGGTNWIKTWSSNNAGTVPGWNIEITYGNDTDTTVDYTNGHHTLAVRATDKAGKTSVKSYDILTDIKEPIIDTAEIANAKPWYRSRTLQPLVTAQDGESSVAKVEYAFAANSAASEWQELTDLNGTWTGGITFPTDGANNVLYLKATDEAGNTTATRDDVSTIKSKTVNIDTGVPSISKKFYQIQKDDEAIKSDFDKTVYLDGKTALIVWGEYSDSVSGVGALSMNLGGSPITGSNISIKYSPTALSEAASIPEDYSAYDEANKLSIKSWKAIIQKDALNTGSLGISGQDIAGNVCNLQLINIIKDTDKPTISNVSVTDNSEMTAYLSCEENAETPVYFVNNSTEKDFTVRGVSIDNNRVSSTVLTIEGKTYPLNATATAGNWNFTIGDLHTYTNTDTITVTITTKDLVDNIETKNITLKIDNAGPQFKHRIDKNGKDVDFRIGEYANDAGVTDVGGKYQAGTWGTATSIIVRGTTDDNSGSGLSKIYYKVFKGTVPTVTSFTKQEADGFIDASVLPDKDVDYTNKDGGKKTISVASTFKGEFKNLVEGSNYILLLAEDKVGNTAIDSMTPEAAASDVELSTAADGNIAAWNKNKSYYSLNVDTTPPTLVSTTTGTQFTNGATAENGGNNITVTGTCFDTGSNISNAASDKALTVSVKFGSTTKSVPATITKTYDADGNVTNTLENPYTWTATIPASDLTALANTTNFTEGKTFNIDATVKDVAGLTTSSTVAILQLDRKAPGASLISIMTNAVEKSGNYYIRPSHDLLTVKGNTDDTYSDTVETYLKLVPYTVTGTGSSATETEDTSETAIKPISKDSPAQERTWALEIPANTLKISDNSKTYAGANLYACTKDHAGNKGTVLITKLIFDETPPDYNNDVKVGDKTHSTANWYNSSNLSFKASWNDAAGVEKVYYKLTQDNSSTPEFDSSDSSWIAFIGNEDSSGNYTFNNVISSMLNGPNYVYMHAVDKLGNEVTNSQPVTIQVDTEYPTVTDGYIKDGKTYNFNDIYLTDGKTTKILYCIVEDNFSGIKKTKEDSSHNTVTAAKLKLGGSTLNIDVGKSKVEFGEYTEIGATQASTTKKLVTVTLYKDDLTGDGYRPVVLTIEDNVGNKTDTTIGTINLDTTAPTVKLEAPKDADSAEDGIQVNGTITIKGNAADTNLVERPLTAIEYLTDNTNWTPLITDLSEANTNLTNESDFSLTIDTTAAPFTDGVTYSIRASAKDDVGNIGTSNIITFKVDKDSDRPVIKFTNLVLPETESSATEETKAEIIFATKLLKGTVIDDDGLHKAVDGSLSAESFQILLNGESPVTIPVKSDGSWSYTFASDDNYEIVFMVKDANGTVFTAATTTTAQALQTTPKLTDGTNWFGTHSDNSVTNFSLMVDTELPLTKDIQFKLESEPDTAWSSSLPKLGGPKTRDTNNKFLLRLVAGDENGVVSVKGKVDDKALPDATTSDTDYSISDILNRSVKCMNYDFSTIDVSRLADGAHSLEITITDGAGNEKAESITLQIDRTAPRIEISSPSENSFESASVWANGTISGAKENSLYYAISTHGDLAHKPDGQTEVSAWEEYNDTTNTSTPITFTSSYVPTYRGRADGNGMDFGITWNIYFDNDLTAVTDIHDRLLNQYLVDLGITTEDELYATNPFNKLVKLYLWMKAEDEVCNVTEKVFPIILDPQGDRPTIGFTYPAEDGAMLGGKVTIYGTAEDTMGDQPGVKSVWVQMISATHWKEDPADSENLIEDTSTGWGNLSTFKLTSKDLDYMADNGYHVYNMNNYKGDGTDSEWVKGTSTIPEGSSANNYAALARLSGNAWFLDINTNREFNPTGTEASPVAIRVYARDYDDKFSLKYDKHVNFDANKPIISNLKLVQYEDPETANYTITASQTYVSDVYVKGDWWLTGVVSDGDKIGRLVVDNRTLVETKDDGSIIPVTGKAWFAAGHETTKDLVEFRYQLGTGTANSVGKKTFDVTVYDAAEGEPNKTEESVTVKYDNKAPEIAKTTADGRNINSIIQQYNGFYKFSSKATELDVAGEKQSGFAYTAFYFKRSYGTTTKLYDALQPRASAMRDISGQTISALGSEASDAPNNTIVSKDELFWLVKNISKTNDTMTVTMSDVTNIHANSLVMIGGAHYFVQAVTGTTITLDRNVPAGYERAYLALAGIVDNSNESNVSNAKPQWPGNGYYAAEDLVRDDGDCMIEDVSKQNTSWTWEANICSRNIPDGPIELCYVVFDKSGNWDKDSVTGFVGNNQPRIAGLTIKTDYTGNNEAEYEFKDYSASNIEDSVNSETGSIGSKEVYDPHSKSLIKNTQSPLKQTMTAGSADNPALTVRGYTEIIPEIVGGNGRVYYSYDVTNGTKKLSGTNTTRPLYSEEDTEYTINYDYTVNSAPIKLQLGDLLLLGDTDSGIPFNFVFKDDTEGLNTYSDEAKAVLENLLGAKFEAELTVYLAINSLEESSPTVDIEPFYWNSLTDNSIYDSAKATSYNVLRGHIELESDWENAPAFDSTSELYDSDPKVSGEIVLKGSAFDTKLLKKIQIVINGKSKDVATYDNETGLLKSQFPESEYATNGIWFDMNQTANTSGHFVEWTLNWNTQNTSIVSTTAQTNVEVKVTATNAGVPSRVVDNENGTLVSIDGTTKYMADTETNGKTATKSYQMDIVPYISGVKTSLSYTDESNPSVYNRTALGHYPVYMTFEGGTDASKTATNYGKAIYETVTITGFNLLADSKNTKSVSFAGSEDNTAKLSAVQGETGTFTVTIPKGAKSGNVFVTVNGIESINNKNNDSASGAYNSRANGVNNDLLTDDVYFDIWDINRAAARPQNNSAKDIMMKVNPSSKMIDFAFCDGTLNWSMAKGKDTSYTNWAKTTDFIQCTGFGVDTEGNSYGVAAGGESDASYADTFNFYVSKWGPDTSNNTYFGTNSLRIGSTVVNSYENLTKNRFQSPSIASDGTYVYLSYFDLSNGEIRFQGGKTIPASKGPIGTLTDNYPVASNDDVKKNLLKSLDEEHGVLQVVADNDGVPDPTDSTKKAYAGEYVSIGLTSTSTPYVVMTWYDGVHGNLMYSYTVAPDNTDAESVVTGVNRTGWSKPETLISGAGKYCQLAVDSDNHIHIACFDSQNGDLKYVYLPDYTAAQKKVCTVDSYQSVGQELTIDVAKSGDYQIPYIGYFGTTPKKPRYAYLANPEKFFAQTNAELNGVVGDKYTGVWECTIVPTIKVTSGKVDSRGKAVITEDAMRRINVGVWKSDGDLTDSVVTGKKYSDSYANGGEGVCYGNGSSNAVLAYGVKHSSTQDYVETAQKR